MNFSNRNLRWSNWFNSLQLCLGCSLVSTQWVSVLLGKLELNYEKYWKHFHTKKLHRDCVLFSVFFFLNVIIFNKTVNKNFFLISYFHGFKGFHLAGLTEMREKWWTFCFIISFCFHSVYIFQMNNGKSTFIKRISFLSALSADGENIDLNSRFAWRKFVHLFVLW